VLPNRDLSYLEHFFPEQQPDGSWIYEANPHGHGRTVYVNGPVLHFAPDGFGYSIPVVEPVGVPPLLNDSYGA
jgi:hypothetical protein